MSDRRHQVPPCRQYAVPAWTRVDGPASPLADVTSRSRTAMSASCCSCSHMALLLLGGSPSNTASSKLDILLRRDTVGAPESRSMVQTDRDRPGPAWQRNAGTAFPCSTDPLWQHLEAMRFQQGHMAASRDADAPAFRQAHRRAYCRSGKTTLSRDGLTAWRLHAMTASPRAPAQTEPQGDGWVFRCLDRAAASLIGIPVVRHHGGPAH